MTCGGKDKGNGSIDSIGSIGSKQIHSLKFPGLSYKNAKDLASAYPTFPQGGTGFVTADLQSAVRQIFRFHLSSLQDIRIKDQDVMFCKENRRGWSALATPPVQTGGFKMIDVL
jgi:hypothetical protein